jgi:hypothetical protein
MGAGIEGCLVGPVRSGPAVEGSRCRRGTRGLDLWRGGAEGAEERRSSHEGGR